ncbi:TasA family protein [Neobacillus sp. PS2-9]|uniref:LPXTG cell wall anchor domain-containing protein n=1 Tax=Neobacillus sp. PS2-9 TaxID=3070676 RepID=UPI0027E198D8|nr:TasA family protein [Neobacillus sp. PS2-9]WML60046.1 TasA family protein [Neobacillus sp. PS2-9]
MRKIILLLSVFLLFVTPLTAYGKLYNNEIDLTTNPGKVLFDLTNIKPGDSVTRDLIIKNNGTQDFNYTASSKYLSGSQEFFNKLDFTIKDNAGIIYEGKLFEFNKLSSRILKSKQSEKLQFLIKVPLDLGNGFQGLSTNFQIKLYVEGTLGGVLPADGPKLPETGTNMFNILVAGAVIVLTGSIFQFSMMLRRRKIERRA